MTLFPHGNVAGLPAEPEAQSEDGGFPDGRFGTGGVQHEGPGIADLHGVVEAAEKPPGGACPDEADPRRKGPKNKTERAGLEIGGEGDPSGQGGQDRRLGQDPSVKQNAGLEASREFNPHGKGAGEIFMDGKSGKHDARAAGKNDVEEMKGEGSPVFPLFPGWKVQAPPEIHEVPGTRPAVRIQPFRGVVLDSEGM